MKLIFSFLLVGSGFAEAAKLSVNNGQFFTDCKIESSADLCFLDTGAFAARVRKVGPVSKYPSLGRSKSKGLAGELLPGDLVKIKKISVGNFQQSGAVAATVPPEFPYSVLGIEFLKSIGRVTFNFDQLEFRKGLLPAKNLCPSKMNLNNQLIQLAVKFAGSEKFAAFDTGASISVVNKDLVSAHPALFKFAKDIPAGKDANGNPTSVKMYILKSLGLCGMDYQDVNFVAIDMSAAKKEMPEFPDLFLGANLMVGNSWSFDFGKKRWYLE